MIYLAAPLFNNRERSFNLHVADRLGAIDVVFLPQRDGYLLTDMLDAGVPLVVAQQRVFSQDVDALRRSLAIVAILDGAHIDEGVAFELGFSNALGKACVGLQTDVRRGLPSGNNPMIQGSLSFVTANLDELVGRVSAIVRSCSGHPSIAV